MPPKPPPPLQWAWNSKPGCTAWSSAGGCTHYETSCCCCSCCPALQRAKSTSASPSPSRQTPKPSHPAAFIHILAWMLKRVYTHTHTHQTSNLTQCPLKKSHWQRAFVFQPKPSLAYLQYTKFAYSSFSRCCEVKLCFITLRIWTSFVNNPEKQ